MKVSQFVFAALFGSIPIKSTSAITPEPCLASPHTPLSNTPLRQFEHGPERLTRDDHQLLLGRSSVTFASTAISCWSREAVIAGTPEIPSTRHGPNTKKPTITSPPSMIVSASEQEGPVLAVSLSILAPSSVSAHSCPANVPSAEDDCSADCRINIDGAGMEAILTSIKPINELAENGSLCATSAERNLGTVSIPCHTPLSNSHPICLSMSSMTHQQSLLLNTFQLPLPSSPKQPRANIGRDSVGCPDWTKKCVRVSAKNRPKGDKSDGMRWIWSKVAGLKGGLTTLTGTRGSARTPSATNNG